MLNRQLRLIQHAVTFQSFSFRILDARTFSKFQHLLQVRFLRTASIAEQLTRQPQERSFLDPCLHQTSTIVDGSPKDIRLVQSETTPKSKQAVVKDNGQIFKAVKSGRRKSRGRKSRGRKSRKFRSLAPSKIKSRLTRTARQVSRRLRRIRVRLRSYVQRTHRTRYVSLGGSIAVKSGDSSTDVSSHIEEFSTTWTTAFAHISAPYDERLQTDTEFKEHSSGNRVTQAAEGSIMRLWLEVRKHRKCLMWRRLMLRALRLSAIDALMIMDYNLTKGQFKPPRHCMEDSLDLITRRLLQNNNVQGHIVKSLHSSVCNLISTYSTISGTVSISQRTIFLLSKRCSAAQLISLWAYLREHKVFVHLNTRMHLASLFLDHGMIGVALEMLHGLSRLELALDRVQSVCVRLLRLYLDADNVYAIRSSMLAQMLTLGLRPNMHLYNVILLNAMEAGDRQTAWRIYQMARDHGLKPDAYTYAILLKGAENKASLEAIWRDAYNSGIDIKKNPRLATEYFYAIYLAEQNGPQNWSFPALLSRYQEFFKISSLHELGMSVATPDIPQDQDLSKLDPPPAALGIMILFYLRQFPSNDRIPGIYDNYLRLVRDRHAVIAPLAMTTLTANAFLMALGRNPATLHRCPSVLEDMMSSRSSDNGEVSNEQPDADIKQTGQSAFRIARPDVRTWSILLAAFLRHGQAKAAEKVLSMMRSRKIKPNQVTWNTLVSGYSALQNAYGAVNSLRRMGKDGFQPDDRTLAGLGNILDRKELIKAFQRDSQDNERVVEFGPRLKNGDGTTT